MIFPNHRNTLILQSCYLYFQEQWKHSLSSVDVGIIGRTKLKPLVHFYIDFFICVLEFVLSSTKASVVILPICLDNLT